MIKHILNIAFVLLGLHSLQAQYTYFNQIEGEVGDLASESVYNIEVISDGYVTWGGGVNNGVNSKYVRKFDLDGNLIEENILTFEDEFFYAGIVNSMQWNPYTEQFIVLQGSVIGNGVSARLLSFDINLELNQDMVIDEYMPYTYFFNFLIQPDGYIIIGEQGELSNSEGTFIMKLNFEGEVIWSEIMQAEVYQHIYRNWSILPIDGGYMVTGNGKINGQFFGLITLLNDTGITQSEIDVLNNDEEQSGGFGGVQLMNSEYLLVQPLGYELVNENGNPNVFWNKTRLVKFNPYTETFYDTLDYFTNYEMILGGPSDLEATPDGGAIILGGRYGSFFDYYAWMMKVDVDGNQEWFHEYTYENCEDCWNLLYDIELAPDGGYVAAGYFHNIDVDVRDNPWLLKVDACGDLEWQGCAPVGVNENVGIGNLKIYPNPAQTTIQIEIPDQNRDISAIEIYDLSGRLVLSQGGNNIKLTIDISSLKPGVYLVKASSDSAFFTQKLIVSK